jgi:hypothetical protein
MSEFAGEEGRGSPVPFSMDRPVHLVKPDMAHQGFSCIQDSIKLLRDLNAPVVVVSLVGSQRGGKSSLLNMLFDRDTGLKNGFGVGHEFDAKTHGLWMWIRHNDNNPGTYILFLDTEGLDSREAEPFYNWTISALSLLISDMYMYQSKSSIDKSTIDTLAMILSVSQQLHGGSAAGEDESASGDTAPSFLWILRDHQLKFKGLPKMELQSKLDPKVLTKIHNCFGDNYDCCTLPRPVDTAEELQNLDAMEYRSFTEKFKEKFTVLRMKIEERLSQERVLAGSVVTGNTIAELLIRYTVAISKREGALNDISKLPTERQMLNRMFGEKAVAKALDLYRQETKKLVQNMPMAEYELAWLHKEIQSRALGAFEEATQTLEPSDKDEYREDLLTRIANWSAKERVVASFRGDTVIGDEEVDNSENKTSERFGSLPQPSRSYAAVKEEALVDGEFYSLWKKNFTKANQSCAAALAKHYEGISQAVTELKGSARENTLRAETAPFKTLEGFFTSVKGCINSYMNDDNALGPSKYQILKDFLSDQIMEDSLHVTVSLERRHTAKFTEQAVGESAQKVQAYVDEQVKSMLDTIKNVEKQNGEQETRLKAQLEALSNNTEEKLKKCAKNSEEMFEKSKKQIEEETQRTTRIFEEERTARSKLFEAQEESVKRLKTQLEEDVASVKTSANKKIDTLESTVEDLKKVSTSSIEDAEKKWAKKMEALEEKLAEEKKKHEDEIKELKRTFASQLEETNNSLKGMKTDFEAKVESMGSALSKMSESSVSKEAFKDMETKLSTESGNMFQKVNETIKGLDSKQSQSVESLETKIFAALEEKMNDVSSSLSTSESSLKESLKGMKTDFEAKVESMGSALSKVNDSSMSNEDISRLEQQLLSEVMTKTTESINGVQANQTSALGALEQKFSAALENQTAEVRELTASSAGGAAEFKDALKTLEKWVRKQFADHGDAFGLIQSEIEKVSNGNESTKSSGEDVENISRRIDSIESAMSGYDKYLSQFRGGLTDEIGAEVARQNIVIETQKSLVGKIEARVTELGSHMVAVEATLNGQDLEGEKIGGGKVTEEQLRVVNEKIGKIIAAMNREKSKRDENSASMWSALGEVSCRVADVLEQVDSYGIKHR